MAGNRLGLGTVQFGLAYGIANRSGQVGLDEAAAILQRAAQAGMDVLDTAIAYGQSEQCLGEIGVGGWHIVTKLPGLPDRLVEDEVDPWLRAQLVGSLRRLGVAQVEALMLHRPGDLLGAQGDRLMKALHAVREEGQVRALGVSIYDPAELEDIWPRFRPAFVQAPYNVLDRRLEHSGWLNRLAGEGVRVHARSIFLQGLLLMPTTMQPAYFLPWSNVLDSWRDWCRSRGCSTLRGALGVALADTRIERLIVGVDSLPQLEEILLAVEAPALVPPDDLASGEINLIDPRRWNR